MRTKDMSLSGKNDRVVGDTVVEKLFICNGKDKYLTIKEQL